MHRLLHGWQKLNNSHGTGLIWMVIIAMNLMVHGFAVEGILEGTQVLPLGFWMWAAQNRMPRSSILFGCLVLLSNWYWSVVWAIVGVISHHQEPKGLGMDARFDCIVPCLGLDTLSVFKAMDSPSLLTFTEQWDSICTSYSPLYESLEPICPKHYMGWIPTV